MKTKILLFILLAPFVIFSQTQIGSDIDGEGGGDNSGDSVSLSSDGTVVAIGAFLNDGVNGSNSGHVRVYQNMAGTWTQVGADIDGESGSDNFGKSVSLSADGTVVAIGAPMNDGGGFNAGHVRVFENLAGTWTQIGVDIDAEAGVDIFGTSVSLSNSGNFVAIGAPLNNGTAGNNTGHVRVHENVAGTWTQVGADIDGLAISDEIGRSVCLSANGNIVGIGSNGGNFVRVYENMAGNWTQIGSDLVGDVATDDFGESLGLSSNGNIIAIGAPDNDGLGTNAGLVRVFENIAGTWMQIGSDIQGELAADEMGTEKGVSLSGDGSTVVIGARLNDGNGALSGHARVFKNTGGVWTQVGVDIDGESANDQSGSSVSISGDGNTIAVGALFNPTAGHVRVYDISGVLSNDDFEHDSFSIYPNPVEDFLTIKTQQTISDITLYDVLGQKLFTFTGNGNQEFLIDLSTYYPGYYFAEIRSGNLVETKKIIKK